MDMLCDHVDVGGGVARPTQIIDIAQTDQSGFSIRSRWVSCIPTSGHKITLPGHLVHGSMQVSQVFKFILPHIMMEQAVCTVIYIPF